MHVSIFSLPLVFLIALTFLTALTSSLREFLKLRSSKALDEAGYLLFYRPVQRLFFPKDEIHSLYIAGLCGKSIMTFLYAASAVASLSSLEVSFQEFSRHWIIWSVSFLGFALASILFGDLIPRAWASNHPGRALKISSAPASTALLLCLPLILLFIKLSSLFHRFSKNHATKEPTEHIRQKIVGIIQESIPTKSLDAEDKKLIESVVSFKDRVVREVMVPRIDIFSLSCDTSIEEAASLVLEQGFSRIPVFKGSVDHIVGVLMYKDILAVYAKKEEESHLKQSISTLLKPVLYTPETKKISRLLQEFRDKQTHLAIVVDEYGGTEGIVTIEDILEEIVGEISDEYDKEEKLFSLLPHGGWIVDARMGILDIEEELGLKVPQDGEYDTIGGYVFHRAGSIPSKGLLIHHDDFELEILSSNDRCIKKVRITPLSPSKENDRKTISG